jgi:spermidine synthase
VTSEGETGDPPRPEARSLGRLAAAGLVFGASAAVLVVEIVALRLLAPYLGLTLETSTLVIGVALAAIALGSWAGGRTADRISPRHALGPLLAISGVAVALMPVAIRGAAALGTGVGLAVAAVVTIMVPGALLAAVTPMVIKLRLTTLHETGTVVGRLSGIGTVGAIVGTVVTGFILISRVPISGIMVGLGVVLVVTATLVDYRVRGWRAAVLPAALLVLAGGAAAVVRGGCDVETEYHCAEIVTDPQRSTGRVLLLDGAPHSYVDVADPTHLEYGYAKAVVAAIDSSFAAGQPLRAYHIGGGGLTVPRYLHQTRAGTTSLVSEIDPGVVRIDTDRLALATSQDLDIRVEDARLGLTRLADDSHDLVIGDAFGGVSVPWHLTTREAVREIHRVVARDGLYVVNVLDYGPLAFARAEVATIGAVFKHVALATEADTLTSGPRAGGNLVVIASDEPLDSDAVSRELTRRGSADWRVITGAQLDEWAQKAPVLTDDYAPVDQLLTPYANW